MATLSGVLYSGDGLSYVTQATVNAVVAASQPLPPLVDQDGAALTPVGAAAANTVSDSLGAFSLAGLSAGTPYHLYVVPPTDPPYWLYYRIPDIVPTTTPCILYGAEEMGNFVATTDSIQVVLETSAVLSGGVVLTTDVLLASISADGTFTLPLWPTAALTPSSPYRVTVGAAIWRGTIPSQATISFDAWIALPTTQRLA